MSNFLGALRYEFIMQIRRRTIWITFLFFAVFVYALAGQGNWSHWQGNKSVIDSFADWTVVTNLLLPLALGTLLADRFRRDQSTHVDELLNTLPVTITARGFGKYIGNLCATLVPLFLIYLGGIGVVVYHWQAIQGWGTVLGQLPVALGLFLTVVLPGAIFVAGFSLAIPVIVWVPLYQLLFVCYWFWGNALDPTRGIPSLSGTILTPLGGYMLAGFFHEDSGLIVHKATFQQGIESFALLVVLGIAACGACCAYLRWQQTR
jgi:ABC-2 type transport system permease protein